MSTRRQPVVAANAAQSRLTFWGALILVGLIVGAIVGRVAIGAPTSRVSDVDYVLMVADLFDRERSVLNARDRFEAIGVRSPEPMIAAAADALRNRVPARQRDLDVIEQLGRGLSDGAAPGASATASAARSDSAGDGTARLARAFLFILVLVAIVAVVARSKVLALVSAGRLGTAAGMLIASARGALGGSARRRTRDRATEHESGREEWSEAPDEADEIAALVPRSVARPRTSIAPRVTLRTEGTPRPGGGVRPLGELIPGAPIGRRQESATRPSENSDRIRFEARYAATDELNDDLHPILEGRSRVLIGAFGLSPTRREPGGPVYAFTLWLHDYVSGGELAAVGLVTKGGLARHESWVDEWQRRGDIADLYIVEPGFYAELKTGNLALQIALAHFEALRDHDGAEMGATDLRFRVDIIPRQGAVVKVG